MRQVGVVLGQPLVNDLLLLLFTGCQPAPLEALGFQSANKALDMRFVFWGMWSSPVMCCWLFLE